MSGTPVLNSVEEFYAYFRFLHVPNTTTFKQFKKEYLQGYEKKKMSSLKSILEDLVIRRTHKSRMLGNQTILNLPNSKSIITQLDFSRVERLIYDRLKKRMQNWVQWVKKEGTKKQLKEAIIGSVVKLRQATAHPLLLQDSLVRYLHAEDFEQLMQATKSELHSNEQGPQAIIQLRKAFANAQSKGAVSSATAHERDDDITKNNVKDFMNTGGTFGIAAKYRKIFLDISQGPHWAEIQSRSSCLSCKAPFGDDAQITHCKHMYCSACISNLLYHARSTGQSLQCIAKGCQEIIEAYLPCEGLNELNLNAKRSGYKKNRAPTRGSKPKKNAKSSKGWFCKGSAVVPSAKALAVKAHVLNWIAQDPTSKILIFTQHLEM